jgi:hypothetical protein
MIWAGPGSGDRKRFAFGTPIWVGLFHVLEVLHIGTALHPPGLPTMRTGSRTSAPNKCPDDLMIPHRRERAGRRCNTGCSIEGLSATELEVPSELRHGGRRYGSP